MSNTKINNTNLFKTKFILSSEGLYLIINNKYYYSRYINIIVDVKDNIEMINILLNNYHNIIIKILKEELIKIDNIIFINNNIIIHTENYIFEMDNPFSYYK